MPFENIDIVFGDTDKVQFGMGTYGSRSLVVGGPALAKASDKIIAEGKKIAAHLLEASEQDITFERGTFSVIGTDRKKTLADIALAACVPHDYPRPCISPMQRPAANTPSTSPGALSRMKSRSAEKEGAVR